MTWTPHPTNDDALRAAGVVIDANGTVVLWHATDTAGANGIETSGVLTSADGQVWFSTSQEIAQLQSGQGRAIDTLMQIRVRVADLHQEIGFDKGEPGAEITHFTALCSKSGGYRPVRVESRRKWIPGPSTMPDDWDI